MAQKRLQSIDGKAPKNSSKPKKWHYLQLNQQGIQEKKFCKNKAMIGISKILLDTTVAAMMDKQQKLADENSDFKTKKFGKNGFARQGVYLLELLLSSEDLL